MSNAPRVTVHIAHAAFLPERAATLDRLYSQLAPQMGKRKAVVHRSEEREHASVWARRVYAAVAAENADAAIVLNDDVEISDELVAAATVMLEQPTSRIISLHCVHPMARSLAESGQKWLRTYHVSGPAYIMRKGAAAEAQRYYDETPQRWNGAVNEDTVLIQMMFRHREPVWNSLPALVTHDTAVPSSLGYDNHAGRATAVAWHDRELWPESATRDLSSPEFWRPEGEIPFLPTHWTPDETLLSHEIANDLGIGPTICWWCRKVPAAFGSPQSGARMCHVCLHATVGGVINAAMKAGPQS